MERGRIRRTVPGGPAQRYDKQPDSGRLGCAGAAEGAIAPASARRAGLDQNRSVAGPESGYSSRFCGSGSWASVR
jgi:hypothetical protein